MKILLAALLVIVYSSAFGGGIFVNISTLFFNQQANARTFLAGEDILMEFRYDYYSYGGKPYDYIVLRIHDESNSDSSQDKYLLTAMNSQFGDGRVLFQLDKTNVKYTIHWYYEPYTSNVPVIRTGLFLDELMVAKVLHYFTLPGNHPHEGWLASLKTKYKKPLLPQGVALYIANSGKVIEQIDKKLPVTMHWNIGGESNKLAKDIEFSYRLFPIEDWSIYSPESSATYYFLRKGDYTFQVKARYKLDSVYRESSEATFKMRVDNQIFQIKKEDGARQMAKLPDGFIRKENNNNNVALVIGVGLYKDQGAFSNLFFVKKDIAHAKSMFEKCNFKVTTLNKDVNSTLIMKQDIVNSLDNLLKSSLPNDNVILYISSHGTAVKDAGYLVPSDGDSYNIANTCLSLNYLEKWTNRMIDERKVKHLLIILDACESGLGVYSKSGEAPIIEISNYMGAHLMTAGLLEQSSYAEDSASIFTKFLGQGLTGRQGNNADYNVDGVVTLSELNSFVQNRVSEYVKKKGYVQTPMLSKLKGAGEMIFILK